ncbi:MAG: leucyl/phenylalanyl-tRNA--protein transferase [Acidobacteria bacterium]|nr:leucyl/phenylalanyl-tRNA--protein transferase [Acidobacteriota bacterium]
MPENVFPDPLSIHYARWVEVGEWLYRANDVVAFGVPLTVETAREAYRKGIFPWHTDGIPLPWHCPEKRAVLMFDELHVPRSLGKERRRGQFTFTFDRDFAQVMRQCASTPRPGQKGTWITPRFEKVYNELHAHGMAHSVEAWDSNGQLAGGLYGIDAGGVFCGESMFYKQPNASKLALVHLIDHLRNRGSTFLDAQVMTPHIKAFGAKLVSRAKFIEMLRETQVKGLELF